MIVLQHVRKAYAGKPALTDVSLSVDPGETYGLLGPNGAGKTTLLRLILGIETADAGEIRVLGETPRRSGWLAKRRLGVVSEHQQLYEAMTPREYLIFFANLYGAANPGARAAQLIERLGILPYADRPILVLSHGMRQKVNLARALVHDPDLVIMDEPIIGLDPRNVREVRDLLIEIKSDGKTLLICSHVLSEVERISDRVGILYRGTMLAEGSIDQVIAKVSEEREVFVEVQERVQPDWLSALARIEGIRRVEANAHELVCQISTDRDLRTLISESLRRNGATILTLAIRRKSLEDAFLTLTDQGVQRLVEGIEQKEERG